MRALLLQDGETSNISDGPSRLDFTFVNAQGFKRVEVSLEGVLKEKAV